MSTQFERLSIHIPNFSVDGTADTQRYNRGNDTKSEPGVTTPMSIGLYQIDSAILSFLQEKIRPAVTQDGKTVKVPVIYASPERWKSVQTDGYIRERNGKILLPIMMIRRAGMKKNEINSPVNKYQTYTYKTRWNSRNMYDRFAALNRITPSVAYHEVMIPDHYEFTYEGTIWTEFIEQMNPIVENISFESDEYWGDDKNGYRFIARINEFEQSEELPTNNDRIIRSKFSISVRGYILPEFALDRRGNRARTTKMQYSTKKVVFRTEVVDSLDSIQ